MQTKSKEAVGQSPTPPPPINQTPHLRPWVDERLLQIQPHPPIPADSTIIEARPRRLRFRLHHPRPKLVQHHNIHKTRKTVLCRGYALSAIHGAKSGFCPCYSQSFDTPASFQGTENGPYPVPLPLVGDALVFSFDHPIGHQFFQHFQSPVWDAVAPVIARFVSCVFSCSAKVQGAAQISTN